MKMNALSLAILFISPACLALSAGENGNPTLSHVISDYRASLASLPLDYALLDKKPLPGVMLQRYTLKSQSWSPQGAVSPAGWVNGVELYIPDSAREKNALLVINNGSNDDGSGAPVAATDFSEAQLARIATATRTVVIAVSNVPNQPLRYQGVEKPLADDDSVAYSWQLFMSDPQKYQQASLHIPMAASASQAFRLAQKELSQQNLSTFMITGVSKRAWAAWLTALSDPNAIAVIPVAFDLLGTKAALSHMYQSYGNNWPVAFYPYYKQGIDRQINTGAFAHLMTLEDPLAYLHTDMGDQLKIDKYIINASGDDFYVPDNSHFYYHKLPGHNSLRVVPNSSHYGILSVTEQSLTTVVNRHQAGQKLPEVMEKVQSGRNGNKTLTAIFSEKPTSVVQWTATNPVARDFRYACDIHYHATPVTLTTGLATPGIPLTTPDKGWQATYLEATFSDGYVATTQVYITPDDSYPKTAPPAGTAACQTLPGRGLTPAS